MPAIQPPAKVLVSGATGYIAAWVVRNLLERGYTVRGTARSITKGNFLKNLFASYGDRFGIIVVEDVASDGAFDEAVKGVDAIEHIASPVMGLPPDADADKFIKPAIDCTVGMLQSVLKDGSSTVKRIVITSSVAAVLCGSNQTVAFTEADWNNQSIDVLKKCEEEGRKPPPMDKYQAAKTLAEMAAWKFMDDPANKFRIGWDLVVLNPSIVFGPVIHQVTTPASLASTAAMFYNNVADATRDNTQRSKFLTYTKCGWIDVRDVAEAHALALEKPAAGGERIIVNAGLFTWQDFIDAANALDPPPKLSTPLPVGIHGAGREAKYTIDFDTSKAARIFGLKYRTIMDTTRDTLADYETRGW